jgi:CBS domain-containing protein
MKLVKDILDTKGTRVWTIEPTATVREALTTMADQEIGALVVTDAARVVGVISQRDYARSAMVAGRASLETLVRDVMARNPSCVTPGHTIAECMSCMTDKRVRHLPVLADDDNLGGVVSIGDVVAAILSDCAAKVDELESFVYGT